MKKNLNLLCLLLEQHRKKLIVMRNTVLILLISAFQVFATGSYAQTKTISLAMNDATIREVLYAIQNQSEFYFLYNSELIDVAKKVDITIEEEKVDAVLARLFDKKEVDFLVKDRYIVLTPVIIINLPSNDATNGYPVSEQISNYKQIVQAATDMKVPVFITTPQPRNLSEH
ncbi:MAG TPA: hypothetical protein ENN90_15265 [Mariniphaga anaerophila]|uniref:Secretin and TonB N terminus short domain-containing protein n=1 Tax=Mariniphaga anaerophila TaxID=1484053 RepID=A0A831PLV2_9BACT|nr:hypothetical protein [Mariniphaga anaerophila]